MAASLLVWGAWFALFVVLELLAAFNLVPWRTLSSTVWWLIQESGGIAAIPIVGGLAILAVHLVAPSVFERKKKSGN